MPTVDLRLQTAYYCHRWHERKAEAREMARTRLQRMQHPPADDIERDWQERVELRNTEAEA